MPVPPTKPCPYCGESILRTAVKCRFCGEFVEDEEKRDAPRSRRRHTPASAATDDPVQFIIPVNVSPWSIIACYAGFIGIFIPLFAVPAVICGIVALRRRSKKVSYGGVTGDIRAVLGLVFGSIGILIWGGVLVLIILDWANII